MQNGGRENHGRIGAASNSKEEMLLVHLEVKMTATNAMKWSVKLTCNQMKHKTSNNYDAKWWRRRSRPHWSS